MNNTQEPHNIGILKERSLHASIKEWYAQPGDQLEVPFEGFVIDIIRNNLLIEIQTGNFSSLKNKLQVLGRNNLIEIVFPIAENKWIVKQGVDGTQISRRKSPKRGKIEDLFGQLIYIPAEIIQDNIRLTVLLIDINEIWIDDGKGSWRRKKWSKTDQKLLGANNSFTFNKPIDFQNLLSPAISLIFTAKELSINNSITIKQAQKMCYALRKMKIIEYVGKRGRSFLYQKIDLS